MGHMVRVIWYGPYDKGHMIWVIWYGPYDIRNSYPWGKQPLVWVVFHCLRNLSRLHGLVYDKTSRNCRRSVFSILTFKYEILFPFCKTEVFRSVSSQYWMIYGNKTAISNLLKICYRFEQCSLNSLNSVHWTFWTVFK